MVDYFKSLPQSPTAVLTKPVQILAPVDIPELSMLNPEANHNGLYSNIDQTDDVNLVIISFKQTKVDQNAQASFKLFTKKIPMIEFSSFVHLQLGSKTQKYRTG